MRLGLRRLAINSLIFPPTNPGGGGGPIDPIPDPNLPAYATIAYGQQQFYGGRSYIVTSALNPYNIQRASNYPLTRFEVRNQDLRAGDPSDRERAELSGSPFAFTGSDEIWVAYSMLPVQLDASWWTTLFQAFGLTSGTNTIEGPILKLEHNNNGTETEVNIAGNTDNSIRVQKDFWRGTILENNKIYNLVWKVNFHGAAGEITLWVNGNLLFSGAGLPMGFGTKPLTYFKYGIYRDVQTGDQPPCIVVYSDPEFATGANALLARVTNPVPMPYYSTIRPLGALSGNVVYAPPAPAPTTEINPAGWTMLEADYASNSTNSPLGTLTLIGGGFSYGAAADQQIVTTSGLNRTITFTVSGGAVNLRVGTTAGGTQIMPLTSYNPGTHNVVIAPVGSLTWLRFNKQAIEQVVVTSVSLANSDGSEVPLERNSDPGFDNSAQWALYGSGIGTTQVIDSTMDVLSTSSTWAFRIKNDDLLFPAGTYRISLQVSDWISGSFSPSGHATNPNIIAADNNQLGTASSSGNGAHTWDIALPVAMHLGIRGRAGNGDFRVTSLNLIPITIEADVTAPLITSSASHTAPENNIYSASVTANEIVTWMKGGVDAALVTLNTTTGAWSVPPQDFETKTSLSFTLTATDTAGNVSTPQTITLTITNVDDTAPTITSTNTHSVMENSVYSSTATANETVTWTKGGVDAALVTLNTTTGAWSIAAQDYETKNSLSFTLTATDLAGNVSAPQAVTINIGNVDEIAPTITSTVSHSVPENSPYSATATANEPVTWTKAGADAALVTLNAATGAWSIPAQDFEIKQSVNFTLTATDAVGNFSPPQSVNVAITDVVEATGEKRTIVASGQSNAARLVVNSKPEFETVLNQSWLTSENRLANGATAGSAALKESANDPLVDSWWYDDINQVYGPAWDLFVYAVQEETAVGSTIRAIFWDQGESDFGDIATGGAPYRARYKTALLAIFNNMRTMFGAIPIVIVPIGRRGDLTVTNNGYQIVREVQKEIDSETAFVTLSPEKFDLADDGVNHLTPAAYDLLAPRVARKVLSVLGETLTGSINGMTVVSASRNNVTVTITVAHDQGTDFTPTTAISGFTYFANSAEVTINSAVRTNATTITLTLAAAPTGTEILYYGYNVMTGVVVANLVRDNSPQALPMRSAKVTPTNNTPVVVESNMSSVTTDVVYNRSAKSYSSGQTLANLIAAPADGSTQTIYDATLGASLTVSTDDPTFVPAAGAVPAMFTSDGGDTIQMGTAVTRLQTLSGGAAWSFVGLYKAPAAHGTAEIFIQNGGNNATTAGFSLRYTGTAIRIATSDGTATGNVTLTTATALPTTGYFMLAFTYNPATKAFKIYINNVVPTEAGTATAAKAVAATSPTTIFFGSHGNGGGFIEDGLINHVLTDTEVASMKSYLQTKYSITIF